MLFMAYSIIIHLIVHVHVCTLYMYMCVSYNLFPDTLYMYIRRSIALTIVKTPKWESALCNTTTTTTGDQTTPLWKLIRKMFKRCTVSEASADGSMTDDSPDNCVYFNYEFLEDFRDPPRRTIR